MQPDTAALNKRVLKEATLILDGFRLGTLRKAWTYVYVNDSMPYIHGVTPDRFSERTVLVYRNIFGITRTCVLYDEPQPEYEPWDPSTADLLSRHVNALIIALGGKEPEPVRSHEHGQTSDDMREYFGLPLRVREEMHQTHSLNRAHASAAHSEDRISGIIASFDSGKYLST